MVPCPWQGGCGGQLVASCARTEVSDNAMMRDAWCKLVLRGWRPMMHFSYVGAILGGHDLCTYGADHILQYVLPSTHSRQPTHYCTDSAARAYISVHTVWWSLLTIHRTYCTNHRSRLHSMRTRWNTGGATPSASQANLQAMIDGMWYVGFSMVQIEITPSLPLWVLHIVCCAHSLHRLLFYARMHV